MKSSIIYPGIPGPDTDPQIDKEEEETTPELPERERKHEVDASRLVCIAVALVASSMLFAQNAPSTPANPQTPATVTQPSTTPQNQGWTMFDTNVGTRLKLQNDQLQRLQEVDGRYTEQYTALGERPWTNSYYGPLTEQRNNDIKSILTPEQYSQWTRTYSNQGPDKAPRTPAGMSGTTTPPTGKP